MSEAIVPRKMTTFKDLTGVRFGRLLVVGYAGMTESRVRPRHKWKCVCDCGSEVMRVAAVLRGDHRHSCGCWVISNGHGRSATVEYVSWANAKQRCTNAENPSWMDYGGRGITMCDRWLTSFEAFLEDMGDMPTWCNSLDRVDVNGIYEPENCRWANNVLLSYGGVTRCASEWARITGISLPTIYGRVRLGWSDARVLNHGR